MCKEICLQKRNLEDRVLKQNINTTAGFAKGLQTLPIGKPFVILGDIGRGKSSFFKHLRFVEAKNELENYIQIDFNFLDRPDSESEIPKFIYSEIERQLRDNYKIDISENNFVRGVLDGDILKLKKTPKGQYYLENDNISEYKKFELDEIEKILSDKHTYFTKFFSHLKKGREQSLAFFFDNLDHRDIKIQEQAFLKASSIARDWLGLVFICLRPNTYYKSKMNGVLDSISTTTYYT